MITINLLPAEFRRRERTSPRVLAAFALGFIVVCAAGGFFGYRWFGVLQVEAARRSHLEANLTRLLKEAKYDDQLVAEAKEYEKRAKTLEGISTSRVLWTKKVDQLIDVVNNEMDVERHVVWFRNLDIREGSDKKGPSLSLRGISQSDQFSKVANFLDDVQAAEFFQDFVGVSAPAGRVMIDERRHPPETVEFPFDLGMKPPKEWERNRSAAAKRGQPAKPGAAAPAK